MARNHSSSARALLVGALVLGQFCRSASASPDVLRSVDDTGSPEWFAPGLSEALERRGALPSGESDPNAPLDVDLVLHSLSGPALEGDLLEQTIQRQMEVLNAAFGIAGIRFRLAEVRRYPDSAYFDACFPTTEQGVQMKTELAVDPARVVNVYACRLLLPYVAGYGSLPNEFPEDDARHGVVLDYGAFPGGAPPLDLGHTLVHEMGHYFGLLHTFQGGCDGEGDFVADTPAEAEPAYGCQVGRNTCPQAGVDPVTNFMDYSDDACTDHFTAGQRSRMRSLLAELRPSLGQVRTDMRPPGHSTRPHDDLRSRLPRRPAL
ncbi:zinc metalloprotease [Dokdonella sp.]|uniref:zinc metalloprotease n=1 Tax=Dokdonella sp. TaxID=2291710 RepID=UPI001B224CED|nr:zinc metalloprotease [Dokdonella sp.]MBO9663946.1 zinc metalloprotease [Dokdonella sp.]